MTTIKAAIKLVGKMYVESTKQEVSSVRERKLRPSGFPYCGLKDTYYEITGGPKSTVGFGLDFYGGVGTAAHLVFQKYMGALGSIVGDWECKNTQCTNHTKMTKFSTQSICSICSHPMEYHELVIRNRHIIGHVDGLILLDGKYYVLDYKTSSVQNINKHERERQFPYKKNVHQILSYCVCLERNFRIQISGWMLQYITRDNPRIFVIVGEEFNSAVRKSERARMNRYNQQFEQATKVIEESDVPSLAALIEHKPCKSYEHWRKEFGEFDKCPLGTSQVCFHAQKLKRVMWDSLQSKKLRPSLDPNEVPVMVSTTQAISVKRL